MDELMACGVKQPAFADVLGEFTDGLTGSNRLGLLFNHVIERLIDNSTPCSPWPWSQPVCSADTLETCQ